MFMATPLCTSLESLNFLPKRCNLEVSDCRKICFKFQFYSIFKYLDPKDVSMRSRWNNERKL